MSKKSSPIIKYKLRAECEYDIHELIRRLPKDNLVDFKIKSEHPFDFGDKVCVLKLTNISLEDLKNVIALIEDGHVMLDTVNIFDKYTGER